jgi:hypothetical protein
MTAVTSVDRRKIADSSRRLGRPQMFRGQMNIGAPVLLTIAGATNNNKVIAVQKAYIRMIAGGIRTTGMRRR